MENQITITLSTYMLSLTVKQQLKKTYDIVRNAFKTGMGCIEFTKNGNIHYHIKTQDDYADIIAFIDSLKIHKTTINGYKVQMFGFTHLAETAKEDKKNNYDYILKDSEKTLQVLKKLKLSDKYNEVWENNQQPKPKIHSVRLKDIYRIDTGVDIDSDTDFWINQK